LPRRSPRKGRLDPASVRRWLEGQQAAQEVIEAERYRRLRELDEATALRIYLELRRLPTSGRAPEQPSPLLLAMRQAVARLQARCGPAKPGDGCP